MANRAVAWLESIGLFVLLYAGVPIVGRTLDGILGWPSLPDPLRWIGSLPLVVGAAGIVWCFALFVRVGHGTPNPLVPPQTLVTVGPFAWTRNPIILSHALAALGLACIVASPAAVLVVLLLGGPVQFIVRIEERSLEARYGDAYRRYREAVPRWLPRRSRQSR
jgi:protein-S-isoprenylcysteine O-methyltransferase Ste14